MADSPSDVLQHGFPSTFSLLAHGVSLSHFAPSMSSKCIALTLSLSLSRSSYTLSYTVPCKDTAQIMMRLGAIT